jgi:hypothetical protein
MNDFNINVNQVLNTVKEEILCALILDGVHSLPVKVMLFYFSIFFAINSINYFVSSSFYVVSFFILFFVVLRTEPRATHILGKSSNAKLHTQP